MSYTSQERNKASHSTEEAAGPSADLAGVSAAQQAAEMRGALKAAPVQLSGGQSKLPSSEVQRQAQEGVAGSGGQLPHLSSIQQSFGQHDVSGVRAHRGEAAQKSTAALGANAYATGNNVAFSGAPTLHTAAHEAAHIVQQRAGVSLSGGVGKVGDKYEQHADAVADAVVGGRSAQPLLDQFASNGTDSAAPATQAQVQCEVTFKNGDGKDVTIKDYAGSGNEKEAVDEAVTNIKAGTAPATWDWYKARVAKNKGKVPGSLKKKFKWGVPHGNHDGLLPGVKGAGGYTEYYVREGTGENHGTSPTNRVVKQTSTGDLFFTNTHYGRDGAPAFTHLGK